MHIYIDIGHPAYAHALRFFIEEMKERGHEVLVTARDKEITHCLLRAWGIPFIDRGTGSSAASSLSLAEKVRDLLRVVVWLLPVVRKFRPDVVISYSSYHAALTGRLLGCPVLTFEDTENVPLLHMVNRILSSRMITPVCFEKDFGSKHIRFDGYKELASLHPSRFRPLPLPGTVEKPYVVLRFVSWRAWHDRGHQGITEKMKHLIAERLSDFARVYISSEDGLSPGLSRYGLMCDCETVHSVLAGARLFFGESASMAAEAAVLGTPAIYIDNDGRGYTRDLEREHHLMFGYGEDEDDIYRALEKATGLLQNPDLEEEWQRRRINMLKGKIDVTSWMVETAENYNASGR